MPLRLRSTLVLLVAGATMVFGARAQTTSPVDTLRQQFPEASIDSLSRAEAALAATSGAKERVQKDFKDAARECVKKVLVNACLDEQRTTQRRRLADIDAIQLEANRYKRRDRSDRLEAARAQREAEHAANAQADAELRGRNREAFEDKQERAARDGEQRARSDAARSGTGAKTLDKRSTSTDAGAAARQRSKNAADYAEKVESAAQHRAEIERRAIAKAADRKKRADAKAAKAAARVTPPDAAGAKP